MNNKYIKTGYVLLSIILLFSIGIVIVNAQNVQPQADKTVFIPLLYNGPLAGQSITGKVVSVQNVPISGVTILTDHGQSVITDQDGNYAIDGLEEGTYLLTPSQGGTVFSPASSSVVVPPNVQKLNFTAQVSCSEAIINGSFENNSGWELPPTEYTAGYSTSEAHTGGRSMRTGIVNSADNRYSYSSARQIVSIPSGTTSAYLTFWIKPFSGQVKGLSLPVKPTIGSTNVGRCAVCISPG
jgi:hypothetical protein